MDNLNQLPAEYSAVEARLADMRGRLGGRVWDVATGRGMDEAKQARAELRAARTALEASRATFKAPLLEACRRLDAEAKRITTEIVAIETPIDEVIKAEERRKEAARLAREAAERARLQEIVNRIQALGVRPPWGADLAYLEETLEILRVPLNPDHYGELLDRAQEARTASLIWYEGAVADMKDEIERRRARAEEARAREQEREAQLEIEKLARHNAEAQAEEALRQAAEDRALAAEIRAEVESALIAQAPYDPAPDLEVAEEPEVAKAITPDPRPITTRIYKVTRGRVSSAFIDEVESIISLSEMHDAEKLEHIRLLVEAVDWGTK